VKQIFILLIPVDCPCDTQGYVKGDG